MGGKTKSYVTACGVALAAFVAIASFGGVPTAAAEESVDPFNDWPGLPVTQLKQLQGGADGDDQDVNSHNVVLANDSDLSNENRDNSIQNMGGTMSTGSTGAVIENNRGFTAVIQNTGHTNNFMQNMTVNIYVK